MLPGWPLLLVLVRALSEEEEGAWRRVGRFAVPALAWAESDDTVELYVRWSSRWSAPASRVVAADVDVRCRARGVDVAGRTAETAYYLEVDLKGAIASEACDEKLKADGVVVTLQKAAPGRWKKGPRGARRWYDRQDALDAADAATRREDRAWLGRFAHKCEACDLALDACRAAGALVPDCVTPRLRTRVADGLEHDARRACRLFLRNETFRANVALYLDASLETYAARRAVCGPRVCPWRRNNGDSCVAVVASADGALGTRAGRRSHAGAARALDASCGAAADDRLPAARAKFCGRLAADDTLREPLLRALRKPGAAPRALCEAEPPDL